MQIKIEAGEGIVTVLEGKAVVRQLPNEIGIKGAITAPAQFLSKKEGTYQPKEAHVLVNREEGNIILVLNEKDSNGLNDVIEGSLKRHPFFDELGVNMFETKYNRKNLIQIIRETRPYFVESLKAGELINHLRDFTAKVISVTRIRKRTTVIQKTC